MSQGIYTALSGALGRQRWLDQVSHDVANAATEGYHGRRLSFEEVYIAERARMVRPAEETADFRPGPWHETGEALDLAIDGPGWFLVETGGAEGEGFLTRAGRFRFDAGGTLRAADGRRVLGADGNGIEGGAGARQVEVDAEGNVRADGRVLGRLALVEPAGGEPPRPLGGVLFTAPEIVAVEEGAAEVRSGFLEGSNVDAVRSMVDMIALHRSFDAVYALIREHHGLDERVIRSVGASG